MTARAATWHCPPKTVLVGVDFGEASAHALAIADAAALQQASLVMMPTPSDRTSWILSDAVARIVGGCDRPVLFMPTLMTQKETTS